MAELLDIQLDKKMAIKSALRLLDSKLDKPMVFPLGTQLGKEMATWLVSQLALLLDRLLEN